MVFFLTIGPIHKWRLLYFRSVIVQISLPSLTLEQEFFSIAHGNEACWANLHKDKRIMNWQPFMNKFYKGFEEEAMITK